MNHETATKLAAAYAALHRIGIKTITSIKHPTLRNLVDVIDQGTLSKEKDTVYFDAHKNSGAGEIRLNLIDGSACWPLGSSWVWAATPAAALRASKAFHKLPATEKLLKSLRASGLRSATNGMAAVFTPELRKALAA